MLALAYFSCASRLRAVPPGRKLETYWPEPFARWYVATVKKYKSGAQPPRTAAHMRAARGRRKVKTNQQPRFFVARPAGKATMLYEETEETARPLRARRRQRPDGHLAAARGPEAAPRSPRVRPTGAQRGPAGAGGPGGPCPSPPADPPAPTLPARANRGATETQPRRLRAAQLLAWHGDPAESEDLEEDLGGAGDLGPLSSLLPPSRPRERGRVNYAEIAGGNAPMLLDSDEARPQAPRAPPRTAPHRPA